MPRVTAPALKKMRGVVASCCDGKSVCHSRKNFAEGMYRQWELFPHGLRYHRHQAGSADINHLPNIYDIHASDPQRLKRPRSQRVGIVNEACAQDFCRKGNCQAGLDLIEDRGLRMYADDNGITIEECFETLLTGLAVRYYKAVAG